MTISTARLGGLLRMMSRWRSVHRTGPLKRVVANHLSLNSTVFVGLIGVAQRRDIHKTRSISGLPSLEYLRRRSRRAQPGIGAFDQWLHCQSRFLFQLNVSCS